MGPGDERNMALSRSTHSLNMGRRGLLLALLSPSRGARKAAVGPTVSWRSLACSSGSSWSIKTGDSSDMTLPKIRWGARDCR